MVRIAVAPERETTERRWHVDYQHLSTLLWREQELLDLLLFKAEEKQYLILTGKTRWLARIAHEIEVVLDQLRTLEVERSAATEVIAAGLGLQTNPSLRQVADAAPAPWGDLLGKHHEALLVLITDLRSLSDANRELIEGGLAAIGDALASTRGPSAGTYGATGRQSDGTHRAVTLDGAL
ncbi:FlgN protein [Blastococcus aggregatus]|uniref:FlgN protein n=1 Tax=Blastococcus aggregatus TaxID=38502 RepID=A0A285UYX5_9ACTN|nr:flagellar protein FlgN [Blastococcus aggregatus]SOC47020.1 FlgN protein [Blastococcus aggregatus]